jgi:hypothetical protein
LIDAVSPRASFTPPTVRVVLNDTSPSCGIDRNRSSPDVAAMASSSFSPTTVTGRASVGWAPTIWEPTTIDDVAAVFRRLALGRAFLGEGRTGKSQRRRRQKQNTNA